MLLLCDTHTPFSADYSLLLTVLWKLRKLNKLHYSTWYLAFFSENTSASGVECPPTSNFMWPPSKHLHESSGFNFNQIARSWCLTIGNWGQKIQILHSFYEIFIEKPKIYLNKSVINSWQLPSQPYIGWFWAVISKNAQFAFNFMSSGRRHICRERAGWNFNVVFLSWVSVRDSSLSKSSILESQSLHAIMKPGSQS